MKSLRMLQTFCFPVCLGIGIIVGLLTEQKVAAIAAGGIIGVLLHLAVGYLCTRQEK